MIALHTPGCCDQWPQHIAGAGDERCLTCHPPAFNVVGAVTIAGLRTDAVPAHVHDRVNERLGVLEQFVSDLIPPQPGEPGYVRRDQDADQSSSEERKG